MLNVRPTSLKTWNHYSVPTLGMGTWHHGPKHEIQNALRYAIRMGYRHIDCAMIYQNEHEVGEVFGEMLDKEVPRSEFFIVGKLWGTDHRPELVEAACRKSLNDLQLDYFDTYLIHWPTGLKSGLGTFLPKDEDGKLILDDVPTIETWMAMERLVDLGLVRTIGFSNFNSKQIKGVIDKCRIKPAILQVESNPRFQNAALRKFCQDHGVQFVAFSPLGSPDLPWGEKLPHILADPVINKIAQKHRRSPAQITLRWQVENGAAVIPKSVISSELYDNLQIYSFQLDEDDMMAIKELETGVRKIIPVAKLKNGDVVVRDKESNLFPFDFEETYPN